MAKPPKKQRLSVYLEPDVMKALAAHAARRDQSLSLIAEAGIASFLSPDAAERQEAATTKRLDQIDRRMARMERDLGIAVETLAVFIRFWLTTNPPLPGARPGCGARQSRRALRGVRHRARPTTRARAEASARNFGGYRSRARQLAITQNAQHRFMADLGGDCRSPSRLPPR